MNDRANRPPRIRLEIPARTLDALGLEGLRHRGPSGAPIKGGPAAAAEWLRIARAAFVLDGPPVDLDSEVEVEASLGAWIWGLRALKRIPEDAGGGAVLANRIWARVLDAASDHYAA